MSAALGGSSYDEVRVQRAWVAVASDATYRTTPLAYRPGALLRYLHAGAQLPPARRPALAASEVAAGEGTQRLLWGRLRLLLAGPTSPARLSQERIRPSLARVRLPRWRSHLPPLCHQRMRPTSPQFLQVVPAPLAGVPLASQALVGPWLPVSLLAMCSTNAAPMSSTRGLRIA